MSPVSRSDRWILLAILAGAAGLRLWYLSAGVPHALEIDEPAIIDRALRILETGNWNPRGFLYPTLVIYLQVWVAAARFLWGTTQSEWRSLQDFDIAAVYNAARFVTALIGTATVWLTYRLGKDLHSRTLGLVAAAQLAVFPMHVRESHFALTDVPTTALVVLTLWLAIRAGRKRTVSAWAWAGFAAGLSAAAKYNGAVVTAAVGFAWLAYETAAPDRGRKALAAAAAMIAAFLVVVPYAVLDLPGFLNGFAGQLAHFSPNSEYADPPWRTYLILLSQAGTFWVPLGGIGAALILWRRRPLKPWVIPIGFIIAYYYVLGSHGVAFGRYALPLVPVICLLAAASVVEVPRIVQERVLRRHVAPILCALATAVIVVMFASQSLAWLDGLHRPDTRVIASRWMIAALPKGARIVAENAGPTNLKYAGFELLDEPNLVDDSALDRAMRNGLEYIVVARWSAAALPADSRIVNAGRLMLSVDPSNQRWGPLVRIIKVAR
jgi:4-amino-4-deoxy-L-arabinose transferase-like glycosyltransferase